MNYLWGGMILIGIIYGTVTGHLEEVSEAAIQSSKEAVSLCVVMAGVTALWVGMMRIAEKSGLLEAMEQRMQPVLNFFVSGNPRESPVEEIDCNESAGEYPGTRLGGDTGRTEGHGRTGRSGGRAAKEKAAGSADRCSSNEMCDFLILNISSLQLIPVSIIAFRTEYGSVAPTAIVGPAILATAVSTGIAIFYIKIRKYIYRKLFDR